MSEGSSAVAEDVDAVVVHCDRCRIRRAVFLVVHGTKCKGGAVVAPPLHYAMCAYCLGLYGTMVKAGRVQCIACHGIMDNITHVIEDIEDL